MRGTAGILRAGLILAFATACGLDARGVAPVRPSGRSLTRSLAGALSPHSLDANGITAHGGPLLTGPKDLYLIWYGSWDSDSMEILTHLARTVGASDYFAVNASYYAPDGQAVLSAAQYRASTQDAYSAGTHLDPPAVRQVVMRALASGALPTDPQGIYFVLTSPDVDEAGGFCTDYCGWHDHTGGTPDLPFAFVGNPLRCPSACAPQQAGPNGNSGADAMTSMFAHELDEAVTDPHLDAWYDSAGNENADKCAWEFGATYPSGGAQANVRLDGRDYLLQENWLDAQGGHCALSP